MNWWPCGSEELWTGGSVDLGLMDLWTGGSVDLWTGGPVDWWSCGLVALSLTESGNTLGGRAGPLVSSGVNLLVNGVHLMFFIFFSFRDVIVFIILLYGRPDLFIWVF